MKVSVIIPTYKPGKYIWQCLDSLCNQTFRKIDYELILILNGPKEPYFENLSKYIIKKKDCQYHIRLFYTSKAGVSNARNIGLDNAYGDYIVFCDDDDWVTTDFLSSLYCISNNNTVSVTNVIQYNDRTNEYVGNFITRAFSKLNKTNNIDIVSGRSFLSVVWAKMIPASIIRKKRFNTKFALGEDSLFIASISKDIREIVTTSKDTVYYFRGRDNSSSTKKISIISQQKNALLLSLEYVRMYFGDIKHNNFLFFATRIIASLRKMLSKKFLTVGNITPIN